MDLIRIAPAHAKNIIREIGYLPFNEEANEQLTRTGAVIIRDDHGYCLAGYAQDNHDIKEAIIHAFDYR